MSNIYNSIIKTFDEVKRPDKKLNNNNVKWRTSKNGQKYAFNEEGEQVAGNKHITQGENIKENAEEEFEDTNDYDEIIKKLDNLDFDSALAKANEMIKDDPIKDFEFKQIIQNSANKYKGYKKGAVNKGIIDGAQAALEALIYKHYSLKEAFGLAIKTCENIYKDQMKNDNIRIEILEDIKSEFIKKLKEKQRS